MIQILTGTNTYALRAALHDAIAAFIAEQGGAGAFDESMATERLDGEEAPFERMQEALQSLPFLVVKKLVILQSPGSNKQFTEKAGDLLKELPDSTDLIIVEPKLDKRLAYYKLLKKQEGFNEFTELDEHGLARWLVQESKAKGVKLTQDNAAYIVERVGGNQQYLANELEKLALHCLPDASVKLAKMQPEKRTGVPAAEITRQAITKLTVATPQSTIFQLLEAAFAGKTRRAVELYGEQRALKVEPQQIIAMLSWQLHILALVKAAGSERTPDTIARDAKLSPYVVKKTAAIARGLTIARTRQLIADLVVIDERLKLESLNADDMLLEYLISLANS